MDSNCEGCHPGVIEQTQAQQRRPRHHRSTGFTPWWTSIAQEEVRQRLATMLLDSSFSFSVIPHVKASVDSIFIREFMLVLWHEANSWDIADRHAVAFDLMASALETTTFVRRKEMLEKSFQRAAGFLEACAGRCDAHISAILSQIQDAAVQASSPQTEGHQASESQSNSDGEYRYPYGSESGPHSLRELLCEILLPLLGVLRVVIDRVVDEACLPAVTAYVAYVVEVHMQFYRQASESYTYPDYLQNDAMKYIFRIGNLPGGADLLVTK